ncbi:hypothetical protein BD779DRAFT_1613056 [Infundibulicybe gibba]|nr:hypothetical protein BD779DRAFT_1613056 [Infundibulicybe gibba]
MVERMDIDMGHTDVDVAAASHFPPPGDEAFDMSHEGGEYEVFSEFAASLARSSVYTLIRHGYLGSAPLHPTVAISIRTLSLYWQAHRTCPRFSIEAQCKTLCHMHNVPYKQYLATQFRGAYDIYLEICRRVQTQIDAELGYNVPSHQVLSACPPCFHKLPDEPEQTFSCLVSMDGNNSLRRVGASVHNLVARTDSRLILSDRWVHPHEVDRFKDEVKASNKGARGKESQRDDDWEDIDAEEQVSSMNCVNRWRNAGPEERKKMFSMFDESGIFIASCRHRSVLFVCDMIKSGELAKYPLALTNRMIEMLGDKIGCAYDIGCAFSTTLKNSSLGESAEEHKFRLMCGSFHGHAHNRACQLKWLPLYIEGTGNTEGEGCEHIFSSSNELARGTRHATKFHRHQAIEEHFNFWNDDKYAALSLYISTHYKQAINSIQALSKELSIIQEGLGVGTANFHQYLNDEREYLHQLKEPPPETALKSQYIHTLNELSSYRKEWEAARIAANQLYVSPALPNSTFYDNIKAVRCRLDSAFAKLQNAETQACTLELSLHIEARWTESHPEYQQYHQESVLTSYRTALDELERLVVMRLFELTKMSNSGTGYKLRRHISKALQRRSEAIRNALSWYNTQAAWLVPPRPAIHWSDIASYSFLGEFDLLRQSRGDVQQQPWAQPAHREATVKYFKLCHAKEEIDRLNLEIRRLAASMQEEQDKVELCIKNLLTTNRPLAAEMQRWWMKRLAVNKVHKMRLAALKFLDGYMGI